MRPFTKLVFATLVSLSLWGCASVPPTTESQEAVIASSLRIATVAYITRAKTPEAQTERAAQVIQVTGLVRGYVAENGNIVLNLDAAAAVANVRIQSSNLAAQDKQLAQAIVIEAVMLAGQTQVVPNATIGAENARRLLLMLGEIERVAKVFGPTV